MSTIKDRWAKCRRLANELNEKGITHTEIFPCLSTIETEGLTVAANREAIVALAAKNKGSFDPVIKQYKPKSTEPADDPLRLAYWFIMKCGSLDIAEKAFTIALKSKREMEAENGSDT